MLARQLRRVHAIVALLAIAALGVAVAGYMPVLATLGWIVVLVVGLPALVVLISFAIAFAYRSSRPRQLRIGPFAWLKLVLIEIVAHLDWYGWRQARPARYQRDTALPEAGRVPVLLVHGYMCNAAVWSEFQRWFAEHGYAPYSVSLEPLLESIDAMVDTLASRLAEVSKAYDGRAIDIVAHSMGGLVTRTLIRRRGAAGIRSVITLGTPHHGTAVAVLAIGRSGCELRRGSTWIRQLEEAQPSAPELPHGFATLFTYDDNLVSPQETSRLPGAVAIPISGIGHASLLRSRRVFELVLAWLKGESRA